MMGSSKSAELEERAEFHSLSSTTWYKDTAPEKRQLDGNHKPGLSKIQSNIIKLKITEGHEGNLDPMIVEKRLNNANESKQKPNIDDPVINNSDIENIQNNRCGSYESGIYKDFSTPVTLINNLSITDQWLVFGYIRLNNNKLPKDVMATCLLFYHLKYDILTFSQQYKTNDAALILYDGNKCVHRILNEDDFGYILGNIEPIKTGIHCWRLNVVNPSERWILFGISQQKRFDNFQMYTNGVFGQLYPYRSCTNWEYTNGINRAHFKEQKCQIDILLDADKGTLQLCIVGKCDDKHELRIWNLPQSNTGWLPHINVYGANQNFRQGLLEFPTQNLRIPNFFSQIIP
eukprot:190366_1